MSQKIERDGLTIIVYRYGFRPSFFAEARDATGKRLAFTGVFAGKGCKKRAIEAALYEAKTGRYHPQDRGCPG
jgi:hypothetical protein